LCHGLNAPQGDEEAESITSTPSIARTITTTETIAGRPLAAASIGQGIRRETRASSQWAYGNQAVEAIQNYDINSSNPPVPVLVPLRS
jgi:hypothetical protein